MPHRVTSVFVGSVKARSSPLRMSVKPKRCTPRMTSNGVNTTCHAMRTLLAAATVAAASFLLVATASSGSAGGPCPDVQASNGGREIENDRKAVTVTVTVTVAPVAAALSTEFADASPFGTSARRFPRYRESGCGPRFPPPPRRVIDLASHLQCLGLVNRTRSCALSNVCYDASVLDGSRRLRFFTGARDALHPAAAHAAPDARIRRPCLPTHATPRDGEANVTADDFSAWVCNGDGAFWASVLATRTFPAFVPWVRRRPRERFTCAPARACRGACSSPARGP